ncbi:hypothetical protein HCN44_002485 [Aphidius gifuensis]|uniref:F-box domain-containing protein n=1 Tax=Aphidius gifuensis TaxID=684658 RepID=A0A835CUA6_APHGI|nr:F-box/LRR-repeat protein 16-like [Aphidius gifuensis]KAF7996839.1 hypothetical protein HCN44_002485 [Aphidius gifuensis]
MPISLGRFYKKINKFIHRLIKKKKDCLDDDCLAEIFMYIPALERPKLALVCKKWKRALGYSWSNERKVAFNYFKYHSKYDGKIIDKKSRCFKQLLLNQCGNYLRELDVSYPSSEIMPFIKKSCPNIEILKLTFNDVQDVDCKRAFANMSRLKILRIKLNCNYRMPESLINSLKAVVNTLEDLTFINSTSQYLWSYVLPNSAKSIFQQFKVLKHLCLDQYAIDDSLVESISQLKNLITLKCHYNHEHFHRIYSEANINPILNLKNLEVLIVDACKDVDDGFLINLSSNAEKLKTLKIWCSSITDNGLIALTELKQLEVLRLHWSVESKITDSSVQWFKNMKSLYLSESNNITDYSIGKVIKNSPSLEFFYISSSNLTIEAVKKADELTKHRNNNVILSLYLEVKNCNRSYVPPCESPYLNLYYS